MDEWLISRLIDHILFSELWENQTYIITSLIFKKAALISLLKVML